MNRKFQDEVNLVKNAHDDKIAYTAPNRVKLSLRDKNQTILFTFPPKYPEIAPSVKIETPGKKFGDDKDMSNDESKEKDLNSSIDGINLDNDGYNEKEHFNDEFSQRKALEERIFSILEFGKDVDFFTYIANDVINYTKELRESNDTQSLIPDSYESMKLYIQSKLADPFRREWNKEIENKSINDMRQKVDPTDVKKFVTYALYSATGGKKSLEECKEFLIQTQLEFKDFNESVESIRQYAEETFQNRASQIGDSIFKDAFIIREHPEQSYKTDKVPRFYIDFTRNVCIGEGFVKAINNVTRKYSTVQCMIFKEEKDLIQMQTIINKVINLMQRGIVRYYTYWQESFSTETAKRVCNDFKIPNSKDVDENTKFLFIQMEYLLSFNLDKGRTYHENDLWKITRQILEALHFIHGSGIVHNNLNLSSLYIDSNNNIKLGNFGPKTRITTSNQEMKNDMYNYGILVFQIWQPENNPQEMKEYIKNLEFGKLPQKWADAFPIQAKIVKLLMQSPKSRPTAIDLLQLNLFSANTSKDQNTKDIFEKFKRTFSIGNQTLSSNAQEVIRAFFSDTSRLPFSLEKFECDKVNFEKCDFRGIIIKEWFNICRLNGAVYFNAPFIKKVNGRENENSLTLMTANGTLLELRQSISKAVLQWVQQNYIQNMRLFSCMLVFKWGNEKYDQILEDETLTYDIVRDTPTINNYIECAHVAITLLSHLFPERRFPAAFRHPTLNKYFSDEVLGKEFEIEKISREHPDPLVRTAAKNILDFFHATKIEIKQWPSNIITDDKCITIAILMDSIPITTISQNRKRNGNSTITSVRFQVGDLLNYYNGKASSMEVKKHIDIFVFDSKVDPSTAKDENLLYVSVQPMVRYLRREKISSSVKFLVNDIDDDKIKEMVSKETLGIIYIKNPCSEKNQEFKCFPSDDDKEDLFLDVIKNVTPLPIIRRHK